MAGYGIAVFYRADRGLRCYRRVRCAAARVSHCAVAGGKDAAGICVGPRTHVFLSRQAILIMPARGGGICAFCLAYHSLALAGMARRCVAARPGTRLGASLTRNRH